MTFTKEQLVNQAREEVDFWRERDELIPSQQTAIRLRLAEITLAALTAEPVYFVEIEGDQDINAGRITEGKRPDLGILPDGINHLYAAPPAPVVDADLLHTAASAIEDLLTNKDRTGEGVWYDVPERLRRAAMLQGAEPVQEWIPCSERLPETDGNYWGWWSESKRQGPVWFIKSDLQAQFQSSEITHWMSLPAAPQQE